MCLQTTWKNPRTAKRDIVVFKLLDYSTYKTANSPYFLKKYTLNKLYRTTLRTTLHNAPFDTQSELAQKDALLQDIPIVSIATGFHAATNLKRICDSETDTYRASKYKCIIPEGSLYYKGLTDLIVSNQIIIKEKVYEYKEN